MTEFTSADLVAAIDYAREYTRIALEHPERPPAGIIGTAAARLCAAVALLAHEATAAQAAARAVYDATEDEDVSVTAPRCARCSTEDLTNGAIAFLCAPCALGDGDAPPPRHLRSIPAPE